MKRIQYHRYGGPETMKLEDFELKPPGRGEVAVKVKFAAINPIDWKVRSGHLKMMTGKQFPRAMGSDFSGIVTAVGDGVTRFKVGDAVFGMAHIKDGGALGEAVVARETFVAKKPETVSYEDAACLSTPGVTAWNGLVDKAGLKPGKHVDVFVNGCTGAVGEATVRLARMFGATVAGTCRRASMQQARDLGVQPLFDYQATDLSTVGERFDIVYDASATMAVATGLGLLRKTGIYLDIAPAPIKFIRALINRKLKPVICTARADILDGLASAAAQGELRLTIAETVALGDAVRLIAAIEGGRKLGGKALVAM